MMGKKISYAEREEILRRAREGGKNNLQKKIARDLKLSVGTVRAIEARAGLRRHPGYCATPEQERAVLALVLAGHGQPHIMEALGMPAAPVRELMVRFRDRQSRGKSGYRYEFSAVDKRAIKRDLRLARAKIAKKWQVTLTWVKEFEALQRQNHRNVHDLPFLPKAQDLLRLLRTLLPAGIPFQPSSDSAAVAGLMQGVSAFVTLPEKYADGLRSQFGEALSMLRREQNGEWLN